MPITGGVSLRIKGDGIVTTGFAPVAPAGYTVSNAQLDAGRVTAVDISTTVLTEFGITQMRSRPLTGAALEEFIEENSYQYSKLVTLNGG